MKTLELIEAVAVAVWLALPVVLVAWDEMRKGV